MQQKIMLASMNSPVKKRVIQTSSIATRKAGGTMMASKSSGCGCGDSKCKKADLLQVCQCKQPKDL
jgi:hypothetical protein